MSNVRKSVISNCEKKFLIKNLSEQTRLDGRAFDEFRSLQIQFGKEWGCCYVSLGNTRVLAQVSCSVEQPKSSRPSEGILYINLELSPMAAPHFEATRHSDLSVQLNRILEKCLKESKAVDLESLCIKTSEKVWQFRVDVTVLNHEGNILDCASIAALAALAHFRRPDCTCDGEEFIIHSYKQRDPIPTVIHHYPVCVSYGIFSGGEHILADPSLLEEGVADAFLNIGLNAYRELCGMHLGGKAELLPKTILRVTNKAADRAGKVVQLIKEAVENDTLKRQEQVVGLQNTIKTSVETSVLNLEMCLDQWTMSNKRKKTKNKVESNEVNDVEIEEPTEEIEALGKGSAALVPNSQNDTNKIWDISSEDDEDDASDEVLIIPPPKVETVEIGSSGSEEEAVVILNENRKPKKKLKT